VRGSLGSINQLVICIGIVAALVVNVVIPATSWRTMFYLATIPGFLLALGAAISTCTGALLMASLDSHDA
jgi:MFS family permease